VYDRRVCLNTGISSEVGSLLRESPVLGRTAFVAGKQKET
jgi:hypothetical protein